MRILGIDYGKKKIGLAISEGISVSPFKIIQASSLKDALEKVDKVVELEKVNLAVVGLPESGQAKKMVEKFVGQLSKKIRVETFPETLSSRQASRQMIKLGKGKKARKMEDAYSAAIILENYLNEK